MNLIGSRGQQLQEAYLDHSGTITTGGTAQLCIPQRKACSHLLIQNLSAGTLTVQIGIRPGVATITNGVVTAISVPDAGFGFQKPPVVTLIGGGNAMAPGMQGATCFGWPSPANAATAQAEIANGTISSIVITNGGSGYLAAPYVFIQADYRDPTGVGTPSSISGILLASGGGMIDFNGTACPTDAVAIWGATTGQAFTARWMP